MKVVSYYRYSTDNKLQRDNSEARQEENVERVIAIQGWNHIGSFTDKAVSGLDDKPEMIRLKEMVLAGELKVDVIAVDALSRLTRRRGMKRYKDLEWIDDAGIQISIATHRNGESIPATELDDDLSLGVKGWADHKYSADLSEVVTRGMRVKFERGIMGWIGKAPYGYELVKKVEGPSTLRATGDLDIVRAIFLEVLNGGSVRGCIGLLEKTKPFVENPEKNPNTTSVKNILRNSIYCGIRTFGVRAVGKMNSVAKHNLKHIAQNPLVQAAHYQAYKADGYRSAVTVDEYQKVQNILDNNQKRFRKFPDRQNHRYSGLVRCADCGTGLNAVTFTVKSSGEKKVGYVCPRSADGGSVCKEEGEPKRKQVRTDELDKMIESS